MLQIKDIYWSFDEKKKKYSQNLKLFDLDSKAVQIIDLEGYSFNYKLSEERFCPGIGDEMCVQMDSPEGEDGPAYRTGRHPRLLDKHTVLNINYDLCPACEKKLGFRSAFFYREEPNEAMKNYLSQTHYIYLAFFAPEIVKVGTASHKRRFIRPIEQDATAYVFIAENDGFGIQDLETAISKQLRITESVNSKIKFKNIGVKIDFERAKQILKVKFNQVKDKFEDDEKFGSWLFSEDSLEFSYLVPHKYFPEEKVHKVDHSEYTNLSGDFLGLRNKYIIFSNSSNTMAMNMRYVVGRMIEGYEDEFSYSVEDEGQIGLF